MKELEGLVPAVNIVAITEAWPNCLPIILISKEYYPTSAELK